MALGLCRPTFGPSHPGQVAMREDPRMVAIEPNVQLMVLGIIEFEGALQVLSGLRELPQPKQRPSQASASVEQAVRLFRAPVGQGDQLVSELARGAEVALNVVIGLQAGKNIEQQLLIFDLGAEAFGPVKRLGNGGSCK